MVNIFKHILTHVKEYCEQAAIHGPQHIVSERLSRLERLVSYRLMAEGWFLLRIFPSCAIYKYRSNWLKNSNTVCH